jgi:O-antigen ligase
MNQKLMRNSKGYTLFALMCLMILSLFFSRTLLAIAIVAFTVFTLTYDIKKQLRNFFHSRICCSISLLFILPVVSAFSSHDFSLRVDTILLKSPLLLLPVAFSAPFQMPRRYWEALAIIFVTCVFCGCAWSFFYYIRSAGIINQEYLRGKSMVTALDNDHVRFSLLVFIALVTSCFMYYRLRTSGKALIFLLLAVCFLLYLHLLAARTGLLAFYLSLAVSAIYFLHKRGRTWALATVCILIILPVLCWNVVPSFRNKFEYVKYESRYLKHGSYIPGSNDMVRLISIRAGWEIMLAHPLSGIGFEYIKDETRHWYTKHYPQMAERDKIIPSSEWMVYGSGIGIGGALIFSFIMLVPFTIRTKWTLPWWLLNVGICSSMLADIGLEVQYGVFIYAFCILWWWKWFKDENN